MTGQRLIFQFRGYKNLIKAAVSFALIRTGLRYPPYPRSPGCKRYGADFADVRITPSAEGAVDSPSLL